MVSLPFVVPIHRLPIPSFYSEWLAIAIGCLGLIATTQAKLSRRIWIPAIAIAPFALIAVILLQWALGMFTYGATVLTVMMILLWAGLLATAGQSLAQVVGERRLTTVLAWFVLAGSIVNAMCGLFQYLGFWPAFGGMISAPLDLTTFGIYGNLAQENHFATHMSLGLVSATYLCFLRRLSLPWFVLICMLCLIAMMLSGSRSTFLYLLLISVLSIGLVSRRFERHDLKRLAVCAALALATLALITCLIHIFSITSPQLQRLLSFSSAIGPRMSLWQHAITMFLQQPLLGVGFDAFAYRLVGQLHPATDPIVWGVDQYAHNLILQLLAVVGLVGLAAVIGPVVAMLRRMLNVPYSVERLWSWGIIGTLLIHSMLEQPLYYTYFLGLAGLVMGFADTKAWAFSMVGKIRVAFIATCAASLVFLLKTAHDFDRIDGHFYSMRYASPNRDQQLNIEQKVIHDLKDFSIFSPLADLIAPQYVLPANASVQEKIAFNERVMRYAPVAEVEFRHAALLAEAQRLADAKRQFARAAFAYPHDAEHYLARFKNLAATDSETYGPLAEYASEWMHSKTHP
jgi:O-antigen ligase